jgi:hypothetical protein
MEFVAPQHTEELLTPYLSGSDLFRAIPFIRWRLVFDGRRRVSAALWRSVFGKTLREWVCVTGQSRCDGCLLRKRCAYPRWFEPIAPNTPAPLGVSDSPPMPYTLFVPPSEDTVLEITVFGATAMADSALLLSVIELAARNGIGKARQQLNLLSAEAFLCSEARAFLPDGFTASPLPANFFSKENGVAIELQSPLRLQTKGKVMTERTFSAEDFIRALLRRITLLHWVYGIGSLSPVPLAAIEDVHLSSEHLSWQVGERYSARQAKLVPLDGLIGTFTLLGSGIQTLMPWLEIGQWTQTGKATTQGLGKYALIDP